MADAYTKVLTSLLQAVYFDVLKNEGVKSEKDITQAQTRFFLMQWMPCARSICMAVRFMCN